MKNEMSEKKERTYNILVYGIERHNLLVPESPISKRNYNLTFEPFDSARRFNEFDGVILFQGAFEDFTWERGPAGAFLVHHPYVDELDKRKKEARLLTDKGGFLCFLLNDVFIDKDDRRSFIGSDLSKFYLNTPHLYRKNFKCRVSNLDIHSNEFRPFLELHGAASSYFDHYSDHINWHVLAKVQDKTTAFVLNKNEYFIPTLVPDNRVEVVSEYFMLLAGGLTSSFNKLQVSLPEWIAEFSFSEEKGLLEEIATLENKINEINDRRNVLDRYKSTLALSGDDWAESVGEVFLHGFGLPVGTKDELREDLKILDENSNPICLCEIKGTNKGVKREYINQADSHRERSNFQDDFPLILVINTNIKNAKTITEKYQDVAKEQVLHAVKMNVLILRTIDLLEMLKLYLNEEITENEVVSLLVNNKGWLSVVDGNVTIIQDNGS